MSPVRHQKYFLHRYGRRGHRYFSWICIDSFRRTPSLWSKAGLGTSAFFPLRYEPEHQARGFRVIGVATQASIAFKSMGMP